MAKKRKLTGGGAMTAPQHPDCVKADQAKAGSLEESKVVVDRPLNMEVVKQISRDILEGKFKVPGLEITPQTAERLLREMNEAGHATLKMDVHNTVVVQNLVQWLPRDPVTGDERIRIAVPGSDREYLFTELTGLIFLEYLLHMEPVRYTLVVKKDVPVNCTCKDFYNRGQACKHIKAITAALKQRRSSIEFE